MTKLLLMLVFLKSFIVHTNESSSEEIVILHTNDIESVYEPIQAVWLDDMEIIGGI